MRRICLIALLLTTLILSACGPKPTDAAATTGTPSSHKQRTPIPPPAKGEGFSVMAGQIMKHPDWYAGQQVTLVGYYRGLDLLDEVVLDAPVSRVNDWVVADDSGAIWVQYSRKLPFPSSSQDVWRIVRVTGSVEVHRNGMPYIVPATVEWEGLVKEYEVLPARCTVAIHRFGGPDDLDHHIYWYDTDNSLAVIDTKTNWKAQTTLRRGENYDLEVAFNKAKLLNLPSTIGQACQGCVRYEIAAVNAKENKPHFVTVYQGSVPDKLQAFIDLVIAKTADAKPVG
jgi:hypothetical protein